MAILACGEEIERLDTVKNALAEKSKTCFAVHHALHEKVLSELVRCLQRRICPTKGSQMFLFDLL